VRDFGNLFDWWLAHEFVCFVPSFLFSFCSKQTLRVSIQQATTILVSFISEQLELDLKRNVRVNEGALTQLEADLEAEEWEKVRAYSSWRSWMSLVSIESQ
jgi:hypothetical protein